jgi:hypothetical protein
MRRFDISHLCVQSITLLLGRTTRRTEEFLLNLQRNSCKIKSLIRVERSNSHLYLDPSQQDHS